MLRWILYDSGSNPEKVKNLQRNQNGELRLNRGSREQLPYRSALARRATGLSLLLLCNGSTALSHLDSDGEKRTPLPACCTSANRCQGRLHDRRCGWLIDFEDPGFVQCASVMTLPGRGPRNPIGAALYIDC